MSLRAKYFKALGTHIFFYSVSEVEDYENDPDAVQGDVIEDILNEELSKGFSQTSWHKDDNEELNLRLESSGPWWSDENEEQDGNNNNMEKQGERTTKGRNSAITQMRNVQDKRGKERPTATFQDGFKAREGLPPVVRYVIYIFQIEDL